ncbi:MAG TPA: hypothetical protein VIO59_09195 [Rhodanobacter sp.]
MSEEQVRDPPELREVWVETKTTDVDVEFGEPVDEDEIDWDTVVG